LGKASKIGEEFQKLGKSFKNLKVSIVLGRV
jgi:hypothetical protein